MRIKSPMSPTLEELMAFFFFLAHIQWHDIAYKGTTLSAFPCSSLFQNCTCSLQVLFWTAKDSCSLVCNLSYLLASRKAVALCPDLGADKHRQCSNPELHRAEWWRVCVMGWINLHMEAIIMTDTKCRINSFLTFGQIKMMRHVYNVFLTPVFLNQGEVDVNVNKYLRGSIL